MTKIYRCKDLEKMVLKMGFLPFFANDITDFSIEEFTPQELWFSDEEEGPVGMERACYPKFQLCLWETLSEESRVCQHGLVSGTCKLQACYVQSESGTFTKYG